MNWSEKATALVSRHFVVKVSDSGEASVLEQLTSNERKSEHSFATVLVRVTQEGPQLAGYIVNQTRPLGLGKCLVPPGLMKVFEGGRVDPRTLKHLDALFNNGGPFAAGRELWRRQQGANRLKDPLPGIGGPGRPKAGSNPSSVLKGDGRDAQGRGRGRAGGPSMRPVDGWISRGPNGERPRSITTVGDSRSGTQTGSGYSDSRVTRDFSYGRDAEDALTSMYVAARGQASGGGFKGEDFALADGDVVRKETRQTLYEGGAFVVETVYEVVASDGNVVRRFAMSEVINKPQQRDPNEPKGSDSNPDEGGSHADLFAEIARMWQHTGQNFVWMFLRPTARPGRSSSVLPPKEGTNRPIGDIARLGDNAIVNPDEGKSRSSGGTKTPLWPRGCPFDDLFAPTNPR
ncbi:MAG: hypothetical protein JST30_15990 [Armatimonadetes bacterium]|nr:hypothetical protein [Armatimonadota bacterium]